MSLGISVGDFIAVSKLVADIVSILRDAKESKGDYQELLRELGSLNNALQSLDKLKPKGYESLKTLDSISYAALSCRRPLENFLHEIKPFEKCLGSWSTGSGLKIAADKLKWSFGKKDRVAKLRSYLGIHIGTINILMAEHGLALLDMNHDQINSEQVLVREKLDFAQTVVQKIEGNMVAQQVAIKSSESMLTRLCNLLDGQTSTLKRLFEMVANVW